MKRSPHRLTAAAVMLATALAGTLSATTAADAASAEDERLERAADVNGMSVVELRELLRDPTAHLSSSGRVYFADPVRPEAPTHKSRLASTAAPLEETFELHSAPGSSRTLYLDFDGHPVSGTQWNTEGLQSRFYAGWDPANDGPAFSASERTRIQDIWQRVAEDYAPFNVDVTTEYPGEDRITRSDGGDPLFGTRALFTDDAHAQTATCGECAGVAFLDVFDATSNHARFQPTFVFPGSQSNKALGETTSHEVGHNFALVHDGKGSEYYEGHEFWAPIMGFSDFEPITQWSNGAYGGTSNQDDVALISQNGAPFRADEAPGSTAGAPAPPTGNAFITSRTDKDVYALGECSGALSLSAQPAPVSPNLDIELRILNQDGSTVGVPANPPSSRVSADVASGLSASFNQSVPAGTYYVQVDGIGRGAPATSYDDYGSLGAYTLQITGCAGGPVVVAPSAPQNLTGSYLGGGEVQLNWSAPASNGGASITAYNIYEDGVFLFSVGGSATGTGVINTPEGTHVYGVAAVNNAGEGPESEVTVDATDPEARPGRPRIGDSTPGKRGGTLTATVRWLPPVAAANPPINGYQAFGYKRNSNGRYVKVFTSSVFRASARGMTFTTNRRGTYKFDVKARNSLGFGPLSAKSNAVSPQ